MSFKYSAISANCGNDTLGSKASLDISAQFKKEELDFCVINCQETDFNKTQQLLQKAFGLEYNIVRVGEMVTRTKTDFNVLTGHTGMVSFVVCKPGVSVTVDSVKEARRDATQYYGTALNKGGVITQCTVHHAHKNVRLELISAHLDSNKTMERAKDWQVIHHTLSAPSKKVKNFSDLIDLIPDIRIAGYDANTRHQIIHGNVLNMWDNGAYELEGLKQMPLGSVRFSAESTYKSNIKGIEQDAAEGKRLGFTKGGMLDFVDIMDGAPNNGLIKRVSVIHPDDPTTKRDHAVIMSPALYSITYPNDFDQVKQFMASMLEQAAPRFAQDLRDLPDTGRNKSIVVDIYREFLSKEGVLNKEQQLFVSKLDVIKKASKIGREAELLAKGTLFTSDRPWFSEVRLHNYLAQVQLIGIHQNTTRENIARLEQGYKNDLSSISGSSRSFDRSQDSMSSGSDKWSVFRSSPPRVSDETLSNASSNDTSSVSKSAFTHFLARYRSISSETPMDDLDNPTRPNGRP